MRTRENNQKQAGMRPRSASLFVACTALLALAGCDQVAVESKTSDEFEWARAALQRNPTLEVVAADTQAEVFTIKVKRTGATQVIKLADVAAAPVSEFVAVALVASRPNPTAAAASAEPAASESPAPAEPAMASNETSSAAPGTERSYTIQRSGDGQVRVSGPGVSIVSSGPGATMTAQREQGERTVDPIICEGKRLLHLDNRNIYVQENAIVARGGCELYITNSRVISSGTAVVAADSIVHIANSTIEGSQASFDAGDGARMFLRSSTFMGLPRRAERAVVQDQGGNTWR